MTAGIDRDRRLLSYERTRRYGLSMADRALLENVVPSLPPPDKGGYALLCCREITY